MKTTYIILITVIGVLLAALIIILAVKPWSCSVAVPVDCVVSAWTDSSTCSAQNTKTQTRTVTTQAANGGASCPVLTQTVPCSLQSGQPFPTGKNMAFINNSTVTFTYVIYVDSSGGWAQYDSILEPSQTLVLPKNMSSYQVYLWDDTSEYGYHGMSISGKFHAFVWGSTTPSMFSLHETNSEASSFFESYIYETPSLISSPIISPPVTSWSSTIKIIDNLNENSNSSEVTSIYTWKSHNGTLTQIVDGSIVLTSNGGDYPNNHVIDPTKLSSLTLNDYVIVIAQSYDNLTYTLYNGLVLLNDNGVFRYIQLFNQLPNLLYITQT